MKLILLFIITFSLNLVNAENVTLSKEEILQKQNIHYWKIINPKEIKDTSLQIKVVYKNRKHLTSTWEEVTLINLTNKPSTIKETLIVLDDEKIIVYIGEQQIDKVLPKKARFSVHYDSPGKTLEGIHLLCASGTRYRLKGSSELDSLLQYIEVRITQSNKK